MSLRYVMEGGTSAEIAVVGNEGVVRIALFMGGETTPSRAVFQSAGYGYRLSATAIYVRYSTDSQGKHAHICDHKLVTVMF